MQESKIEFRLNTKPSCWVLSQLPLCYPNYAPGGRKYLGVNHRDNGEVGWQPGAGHDACHGLIKVRPQPSNPEMSRVATAAPATKAVVLRDSGARGELAADVPIHLVTSN